MVERGKEQVDKKKLCILSFRTTPQKLIGETPYLLSYGTEAVISLGVDLPTLHTMQVEAVNNDAALKEALEYAGEIRKIAFIRLANYQ